MSAFYRCFRNACALILVDTWLGAKAPNKMSINDPTGERLKEDREKIQESILYLLKLRPRLTQFQIGKALYFADLHHLNVHGRPVTFDNYVAMVKGPVPSLAYNALKPSTNHTQMFRGDRPWTSTPKSTNADANEFVANRAANEDWLSETDKDALKRGLHVVLTTPADEFHRLTHDNEAYREAWERRGSRGSSPMSLALMIEGDGKALMEDLVYVSAHS